ncbi:MAG: DUF4956 domain-containing protein [Lachnospiraceae bacterium]|nr:DUF4956 domain-containing protein [Lachnospiraceae bacterium]
MSFKDAIRRSVLEGFANTDMPTSQILTILAITFAIGLYIYFIYRLVNKSSLYDKSFHIAMAVISVVTAGIIIAMQSSIVISLGMVGALSIVRFRTAVKDAMDLLFLFWSIGEGIICGAGLFEIAVIVALMVTVGIFILEYIPVRKKPYLLILSGESDDYESELMQYLNKYGRDIRVKSRNLKNNGLDIICEIRTDKESELMAALKNISGIKNISLLTHEGEVRF